MNGNDVERVRRPVRVEEWLILLVCLISFAAQALYSSPQKSAAFDEQYHLAAGYAYLKTGDFRMSLSHPPLINALSALPLLSRTDIELPLEHPSWAAADYFIFSDVFMWQANNDAQGMLVAARTATIGLGVALAAAIFLWTRQWAGRGAAWAALALATFDPNLLANARLVTTDLGLALFYFLAFWLLWRWLKQPSWTRLLLAGMAAGLATASKFTGLMVWPTFFALLLIYPGQQSWRHRLLAALIMSVAGYVALWAVYSFDVGPVPGFHFDLPIAAPFYPYSAWDTFMVIEDQPKTSYLLGQLSPRGWWYYFPVALAVKSPLPLLLLAAVGVPAAIRRQDWRTTSPLWFPPALFLLLAMSGRITIGFRHILPVVPFVIVLAAYGAKVFWRLGQRAPRGAPAYLAPLLVVSLLVWQAVDVLRLLPHQEAYFNSLAGGPRGGDRVLIDSNLDWGQDLIALRQLLEARGIDNPYLAYFGTALPEAYGLSYRPLPSFLRLTSGPEVEAYNPYTPAPGWYAISRSSLHLGLLHQNQDIYAFFRDMEPVDRAGHSINLYHMTYEPDTAITRTVVSGRSVADITPQALGAQPEERLIVKWTSSPETDIFPFSTAADAPEPQTLVDADFEGVFTLTGYDVASPQIVPGAPLTLTLTWRVGHASMPQPSPATAAPLAAFVHLSDDDPSNILTQYDGWGTALHGLEPGDTIRQRVTLIPPEVPLPQTYYLQIGLYSPQSGERLRLSDGETFVRLGPFVR